jgi:hypothetical protein
MKDIVNNDITTSPKEESNNQNNENPENDILDILDNTDFSVEKEIKKKKKN